MENNLSNLSATKSLPFMDVLVDYAFKRIFGTPPQQKHSNISAQCLSSGLYR